MDRELRAYFFTNMYLTGIHSGIQAQHCTSEMFTKYDQDGKVDVADFSVNMKRDKTRLLLSDWAKNHKTTIILNGGYASNLTHLVALFSNTDNPYPWGYFRESVEALNGCITSVGIILPDIVYNHFKYKQEIIDSDGWGNHGKVNEANQYDCQIAEELNKCKLMN